MTAGEANTEAGAYRCCYLAPFQLHLLREAAEPIAQAYDDSFGAYLVGSCLLRANYRDVDVRIIMPNDAFSRLFGDELDQYPGHCTALWMLQTKLLSEHLSRVTGLMVDCQIQSQSTSRKHPGPRDALIMPPYLLLRNWDGGPTS